MKPDESYKKRIESEIGVSLPCDGVSSDEEEQHYVIKKRSDDFGKSFLKYGYFIISLLISISM